MPSTATFYKELQTSHPGLRLHVANFTFNGTGQPDAAEGKPFAVAGTDLVRTSIGLYTLTLPGAGALDVLGVFHELEDGTKRLSSKVKTRTDSARTIAFEFTAPQSDTAPAILAGETVTSHAWTAAGTGYVVAVEATTADSAGVKTIQASGSPAAGAVTLSYTAGVPTLTFNATDNVSAASIMFIPTGVADALADPTDGAKLHVLVLENHRGL